MTDKGRILVFPDAAAIEAEAAAWVARFDGGDVSAKDQAAFQEWLNRSALHREIIAEYGSLWSEFDALKPLAGGETGSLAAAQGHAGVLRRAGPWLAACAAVVLVIVGGTATFHPELRKFAEADSRPATGLSYETAVGGKKRIALADGSTVILNTNSRLDVDFSGNRRDVHLVRGEAFFEVVHDKTRPFTVYANKYVVRDIGTAFDVHLSRMGIVEVGVTKGSVEVAPAIGAQVPGPAKSPSVLVAGQNVVLGQKVEHPEIVSSNDLGRKLAWRQGQLIYTGQPLKDVLADISRYSDIQIELADPALANLPVGGAFRTDQIEAIFAALEDNFGVQAEWTDTQHVRFISAREKPVVKD